MSTSRAPARALPDHPHDVTQKSSRPGQHFRRGPAVDVFGRKDAAFAAFDLLDGLRDRTKEQLAKRRILAEEDSFDAFAGGDDDFEDDDF